LAVFRNYLEGSLESSRKLHLATRPMFKAGGYRIPVLATSVVAAQTCSVHLNMLATVADEYGLK
jgi:hypothetical protein